MDYRYQERQQQQKINTTHYFLEKSDFRQISSVLEALVPECDTCGRKKMYICLEVACKGNRLSCFECLQQLHLCHRINQLQMLFADLDCMLAGKSEAEFIDHVLMELHNELKQLRTPPPKGGRNDYYRSANPFTNNKVKEQLLEATIIYFMKEKDKQRLGKQMVQLTEIATRILNQQRTFMTQGTSDQANQRSEADWQQLREAFCTSVEELVFQNTLPAIPTNNRSQPLACQNLLQLYNRTVTRLLFDTVINKYVKPQWNLNLELPIGPDRAAQIEWDSLPKYLSSMPSRLDLRSAMNTENSSIKHYPSYLRELHTHRGWSLKEYPVTSPNCKVLPLLNIAEVELLPPSLLKLRVSIKDVAEVTQIATKINCPKLMSLTIDISQFRKASLKSVMQLAIQLKLRVLLFSGQLEAEQKVDADLLKRHFFLYRRKMLQCALMQRHPFLRESFCNEWLLHDHELPEQNVEVGPPNPRPAKPPTAAALGRRDFPGWYQDQYEDQYAYDDEYYYDEDEDYGDPYYGYE